MSAHGHPLYIDIPVKLSDVKIVFSVGDLQFEGDLPASIFHMQLIKDDVAGWGATSESVAVFHTNAGHVTLHDTAYNADLAPLVSQLIVTPRRRNFGKDFEMDGSCGVAVA